MSTNPQPVVVYQPKKILQGANLYSRYSILVAELDASVSGKAVDEHFIETALQLLNDYRPSAVSAALDAMAPLPDTLATNSFAEVLTYLALTLQRWCGLPVSFAKALENPEGSQEEHVVIECRLDHLATAAGQIAAEVCLHCINPEFVVRERIDKMIAEFDRVFISGRAAQIPFIQEAEAKGIPWLPLTIDGAILAFGQGSHLRKIHQNFTSNTGFIASKIASDKYTTANILRAQGIPVPKQVAVTTLEVAIDAAQNLGFPLVVKPLRNDFGEAVFVGVNDVQGVTHAFNETSAHGPVLIEQLIPGDCYRLMVINGKFRSAQQQASAQAEDEKQDASSQIHPANIQLAERAAAIIDIDIAGLDFITTDISKPYWEVGAAFCEVNVTPGLELHEEQIILGEWFPEVEDGRIVTIVLLDPSPEKNRGTKIAEQLQSKYSKVCLATKQGLLIDGEKVSPGNFSRYQGLRAALCEPGVNAVVLEIDADELIKNGLGIDRCDLSVFASLEEGSDQRMAEAARGVLETISACVLDNSIVREGKNASLDAKQLAREINSNLS